MNKIKRFWEGLPPFMRRYSFWFLLLGLLWILFLQPYSVWNLWEMRREKHRLEQQVADYEGQIDSLKKDLQRLNDPAFVEGIARVRYGMKRPDEKVFVLIDE